jgi:predicted phage tail protein
MDLRKPSGWFFVLLGALLLVAALGENRAPMLAVNLNAIMSGVMVLFGASLLTLAWRAAK